jgi:predicted nucleic acid-binding protein
MSGRYLLDTNILIDLLEGNEAVSYLILSLLSFFTIIPLNDDVERKAIAIRRETGLKLPDAIIAASSISVKAVLITRDQRLTNLKWQEFHVQSIMR